MTTLRGGDNIPGASTLTAEERAVVRTGLDALDHLEHSIYRLMEVGDAVLMLKAKAESVVGATERTFPNLLRLHGFEQLTGKNRALLTRLLQIMDKREQVLAWHTRLPLKDKLAWLSPSSIVRHFPALVDAQSAAKRATNAQARPPNAGHDAVALRKQVKDLTGRLEEVEQERDAFREQLATRAGPVDLAQALQARTGPLGQASAAPPVPAASDDATKQAMEQFAAGIENLPRKRRFEILLDLYDRLNMIPSDVSSAWNRRFEARGGKSFSMAISARPAKKRK